MHDDGHPREKGRETLESDGNHPASIACFAAEE